MQIEIWSVGKTNEFFIEEGIKHFIQKTKPYCEVSLVVITPTKKDITSDTVRNKQLEGELILRRLKPHHYLILLDEKGTMLNSTQWALQVQHLMNIGTKTIVLLIGGAFGVNDDVKKRAKQIWSLSHLVFPHQLVRLILAEQIYRSFSILNNSPYHHS